MCARVTAGARLHFGFQNLSLARPRLYGSLGLAVERPRFVIEAEPAEEVVVETQPAEEVVVEADAPFARPTREYAARTAELLDLPGVAVEVLESFPRHVGLGSGTQLALATLAAVARAYDREANPRSQAPDLGRGGRSGVGVATFERGGFAVDAGHPTERFTAAPPDEGDWTVPPVIARHEVPTGWRFVVIQPDGEPGRSGESEDASMRTVVEGADPGIADEISVLLTHRLLPAIAEEDVEAFGTAVAELGRLNGAWYADQQGGVYRPPVGKIVDELSGEPAISGAGQSSWGPCVYGITDADRADAAREAAHDALDAAGVEGEVVVTRARNEGARVEESEAGGGDEDSG